MYELNDSTVQALVLGAIITMPIKALALWRASHNGQKVWFGALLVLNTIGMLDLTYLFYFSKPKKMPTKIED
ncbi:hypothetical protein BH09PAT4_BH09PAT4_01840 [soil metagenome]